MLRWQEEIRGMFNLGEQRDIITRNFHINIKMAFPVLSRNSLHEQKVPVDIVRGYSHLKLLLCLNFSRLLNTPTMKAI